MFLTRFILKENFWNLFFMFETAYIKMNGRLSKEM